MTTARKVKEAYQAGMRAEQSIPPAKQTVTVHCPDSYENSPEERKAWYDGYYTSYLTRRHKATFEKYGIKYP